MCFKVTVIQRNGVFYDIGQTVVWLGYLHLFGDDNS